MSSTAEAASNPPSSSHNPPKNVPWTYEENDILLMRVKEYVDSRGRPKWAQVSKGLPGRTAQEARCRYRRISDADARRKRGESFRNKCHTCGQLRRGHVCPGVTIESRNAKLGLQAPEPEAPEEQAADATDGLDTTDSLRGAVEGAPCEEPPELKLEDTFEKLEVSVGAADGFEEAAPDAFPALPDSIQRSTSMVAPLQISPDTNLNELLGAGPSSLEGALKRMPSMTNYIEAFFNADGFLGDGFEPLSPHGAALLGRQSSALAIEVM